MRPRIGITSGSAGLRVAAGVLPSHYVGTGYARAVDRAGGTPVILPAVAGSERELALEYAAQIHGLVLAGGTDIHPHSYREPIQQALTDGPDLSRDTLELALVAEARRTGMPVLGICRGMQLLNVAYGGSLHQHKPHAQGAGAVVNGLKVTLTEVTVRAGSRLRDVLGRPRARVYCIHHQAIGRLGRGLAATAHSSDGLVEAVEDPSARLVLGVMWHPEQMSGQVGADAPYRALVSAAAARVQAIPSAQRRRTRIRGTPVSAAAALRRPELGSAGTGEARVDQ